MELDLGKAEIIAIAALVFSVVIPCFTPWFPNFCNRLGIDQDGKEWESNMPDDVNEFRQILHLLYNGIEYILEQKSGPPLQLIDANGHACFDDPTSEAFRVVHKFMESSILWLLQCQKQLSWSGKWWRNLNRTMLLVALLKQVDIQEHVVIVYEQLQKIYGAKPERFRDVIALKQLYKYHGFARERQPASGSTSGGKKGTNKRGAHWNCTNP